MAKGTATGLTLLMVLDRARDDFRAYLDQYGAARSDDVHWPVEVHDVLEEVADSHVPHRMRELLELALVERALGIEEVEVYEPCISAKEVLAGVVRARIRDALLDNYDAWRREQSARKRED